MENMKILELEQITGLTITQLYSLLLKSSWNLMDAYAVTGREPYLREAETLSKVNEKLSKFIFETNPTLPEE